ncbi:GNAT family N-acetyltransferase [Paenarthrobacter sp. Z7-10]|uniref:GNAT family N-acetyltransferase n=1 Tax=Paenarthrobacter sp. Z7-10 TaxID=2787635 RepID=UPI0022A937CA|nr:GNAT family N-acetyltransferase [Paenarthrobacter sp. Z7-10]MCZ2404072.1 GNAT family N-acetyltransferase [Paenarthrobacter sp. Z7-10]
MKTLTTERLTLRSWTSDDADFVFDMYSRWDVQRYIGGSNARIMELHAEAVERIERWQHLDHPIHGIWAVQRTSDGQLLGTLLLKPIPASGEVPPQPSGETEIGWHFHPDAWRYGYATEAAAEVLRHGLAAGLGTIVAVTAPENVASQNVCKRIGMEHQGTTVKYYNETCELFLIASEAHGTSPAAPGA